MMILSRLRGYFGDKAYAGGDGEVSVTKGRASVGVAAKSIPSTLTIVDLSPTPKYDVLGELDLGNNRFVAAHDGYYHYYISLYASTLATGPFNSFTLSIRQNSISQIAKTNFQDPVTNFFTIFSYAMIYCNQGDVLNFFAGFSAAGSATMDIIDDPTRSYIEIYEL